MKKFILCALYTGLLLAQDNAAQNGNNNLETNIEQKKSRKRTR